LSVERQDLCSVLDGFSRASCHQQLRVLGQFSRMMGLGTTLQGEADDGNKMGAHRTEEALGSHVIAG
jgi:hypothetical protein